MTSSDVLIRGLFVLPFIVCSCWYITENQRLAKMTRKRKTITWMDRRRLSQALVALGVSLVPILVYGVVLVMG